MFREGSIDELCRLLERYCPTTWKRITGKRYRLPDYRVADYANQIALNKAFIRQLWQLLTNQDYGRSRFEEDITGILLVNQALGLKSNRPVYFLKPDHGAALMRTDLPADLSFSDIRWRHPQLRIMLPLSLLRCHFHPQDETATPCVCLDLARTGTERKIHFPQEFAQELDLLPDLYRIRQDLGTERPIEEMEFVQREPMIAQITTVPLASNPAARNSEFRIAGYSVTESSFKTLLAAQEHFDLSLQELVDAHQIQERLAHLGLQCLLYMSREEEEPPEEIIRRARMEGRHLQSSIVRAKFVDEYCRKVQPGQARIVASYEGKRSSPVGHWVRGHWRRFAVGQDRLERRLQWVQPFQRGES